MSHFSIDIEKYYEELLAMGRQLKGIFCLQYPILCIHSEISDSTPDPLDNLDKVIVDFLKVKPDFSSFQIGSIIGTSKTLIELRIEKLIMGDTDSPLRANFKGKIDLQDGNTSMSPLDLSGEIAFSENFRQALPLIDMMFQSFNQKDGFYQVRLGGTLGSPKPIAP